MATDNEMTVLELSDAENVAASDLLYLIQGDGATRDRKLTLDQLINFIQYKFNTLIMNGSSSTVSLTTNGLSIVAGGATISVTSSGVSIQDGTTGNSASFGNGVMHFSIAGGYEVTIQKDYIEVSGNGASTIIRDGSVKVSATNVGASEIDPNGLTTPKVDMTSVSIAPSENDTDKLAVRNSSGVEQVKLGSESEFKTISATQATLGKTSVESMENSGSETVNGNMEVVGNAVVGTLNSKGNAVALGNITSGGMVKTNLGVVLPIYKESAYPSNPVVGQTIIHNAYNGSTEIFMLCFYNGSSWVAIAGA